MMVDLVHDYLLVYDLLIGFYGFVVVVYVYMFVLAAKKVIKFLSALLDFKFIVHLFCLLARFYAIIERLKKYFTISKRIHKVCQVNTNG